MPGLSAIENGKLGGRPKGSFSTKRIEASKLREFITKKVAEKGQELLDAKLDLALGHKKAHTDIHGNITSVYLESPDPNSIRYLLDQTIGKATESLKIEGDIVLKIDV